LAARPHRHPSNKQQRRKQKDHEEANSARKKGERTAPDCRPRPADGRQRWRVTRVGRVNALMLEQLERPPPTSWQEQRGAIG
jgi:hypothetical protein